MSSRQDAAAPGDECVGGLFVERGFLDPLEVSGCVRPHTGWTPVPLDIHGVGHAPVYLKTHSWGEFVFDFEIAQAYAAQGLAYYPKLVSCVPYTPVPGPRLIAGDDNGRAALAQATIEQARAHQTSSAHLLYLPVAHAAPLAAQGWLHRVQPRYLWRNADHADFDAFLATLPAKRRKNIRRERRLVADAGLDIHWCAGAELDADDWPQVFALYASTYALRGQRPYLNLRCLRAWAENFGERMQFCCARRAGALVAMAFFFVDGDSLYGRHWGAAADLPLLHFELCYYQGIDYAIRRRLRQFDAGVQGEHKLTRGFAPALAHSVHWYADARLRAAIARFYQRERAAIETALSLDAPQP